MKRIFLFFFFSCILVSSQTHAQNQAILESDEKLSPSHQAKSSFVSGGVTFYGLSTRAGYFPKKNWWVGAEGELHFLFSTRVEGGIFTRYYTGDRKPINAFFGGGLSYGYFEIWNWDIDNPKPPQIYRSPKINALAGLEIRLTRRVNLEGVIKAGRLTQTNWIQPSLQGSVTIYLGKQYQSLK